MKIIKVEGSKWANVVKVWSSLTVMNGKYHTSSYWWKSIKIWENRTVSNKHIAAFLVTLELLLATVFVCLQSISWSLRTQIETEFLLYSPQAVDKTETTERGVVALGSSSTGTHVREVRQRWEHVWRPLPRASGVDNARRSAGRIGMQTQQCHAPSAGRSI